MQGQEEMLFADHIGSSDGLTSQLCNSILEDSYGNLWIGLKKEVNKYDGYNVVEFNPLNTFKEEKFFDQLAEDIYRRVWMISITEDKFHFRGDLFSVLGLSHNVHIVDPLTNHVLEFHELFPNAPFALQSVIQIYVRENSIFFYTQDQKLYRYREDFQLMLEGFQKDKFIGVEDSLHYFHKVSQNKLVCSDFFGNNIDTIDLSKIAENPWLRFEANGGLTITSKDFETDTFHIWKNSKLHSFKKSAPRKKELYHYVRPVKYDEKQDLLLQEGIFNSNKWDLSDEQIEILKRRNCLDFEIGKSGLLYAATGLGVYILERKENFISSITDVSNKIYSMRKMIMDNDIVISVKKDNEYISSPSGKFNTSFVPDSMKSVASIEHYLDPIDSSTVYSGGWSFDGLVRKIDFENETFEIVNIEAIHPIVGFIRSSTTKDLYVYGGNGIAKFSQETQTFERGIIWQERNKNDNINISNFRLNNILEIDSKFWMSTNVGILVYDLLLEKFVNFKFQDKLLYTKIEFLHIDKFDSNVLWVGTSSNGLKRLNLLSGKLDSWDDTNGLSNNSVHFIYQDTQNRLWLPTNKFLNCLDVESNRLYKFTEEDGIAHSEFNTYSFYKNEKTGELYLGGLGGISHFKPDSIQFGLSSDIQTRILSVGSIDDEGQQLTNNIYDFESAQLTMKEEYVALNIKLATSQVFNNEATLFSYKMPPFINDWIQIKGNELSLARLPYGEHKLHFISNVHNPRLTSSELIIDLSVERPFVKTWLFYSICLMILAFLVWLYIRQRTRTIERRNKQLESLVEKRTKQLEQANNSKTRIFQILAHDLRSPIASLANLSKIVEFLSSKNRLQDLEQVALETERKVNALNDNLDNLLQWAIIEKGNITNKPIEVNVHDVFLDLINIYKTSINLKNLKLRNHLKESERTMVDITIFQTISRNALQNAIKFCKEDGNISIYFENEKEYSCLKILNDHDPRLEENMKGNGLGFQISQELAALSNGLVELNIIKDEYSEFKFTYKN